MFQREVAGSFVLALGLAATGIGRPLNARRQRWPLPRLRRSGRAGGEGHPPAGLSTRRGPDRADTPSARSMRALEMPRQ
jgi:hypothetical protein